MNFHELITMVVVYVLKGDLEGVVILHFPS